MLSAVLLTKNEEADIKDCITSASFCDEILVVDDNSTDKTTRIAQKIGIKVFKRNMNKNFAQQSNFGMLKAKGEWILFLDADERISTSLRKEIVKNINEGDFEVFKFKRIDVFHGKRLTYGEAGNSVVTRLVKRNSGKWSRRVHPTFQHKGQVKVLKNPIYHYSHKNMNQFVQSINLWSSWHAKALKEEKKNSSTVKIFLWPILKAFQSFVLKRGYKDGTEGFIYTVMMSFHSFLAWSKNYVE